jgi:hypothetical protein
LSEPGSKSRAAGHFYLTHKEERDINNWTVIKWTTCNPEPIVGCKPMWRLLTCYVRDVNNWMQRGILSPLTWMYSVLVCTALSLACTSSVILYDFWWIRNGGIHIW